MLKRVTIPIVLALVVSCQKTPAQSPSKSTQEEKAAPASPVAQAQQKETTPAKPVPQQLPTVLAKVNGESIEASEFQQTIHQLEQRAGQPIPADQRDAVYRDVLDQLIGFHLLIQESASRKMAATEAEVSSQVDELKKRFPDAEAFDKKLAEQKLTLDQLRTQISQRLSVSKLLEAEVSPKLAVQPKDISDFYEANMQQFLQEEALRVSHVLIRVQEGADQAAKDKAKAEAEDLLKQAKAGVDFAKLAREHSQDPGSAQKGGELPFFSKGEMVPPFETAAFALKPGEISNLVETEYGYHIIKLHERRPARQMAIEEVSDKIKNYLTEQQRQQKADTFVKELKTKGKVEIYI